MVAGSKVDVKSHPPDENTLNTPSLTKVDECGLRREEPTDGAR